MADRELDLIEMLSAVFGPPTSIPGLTDQEEPDDIIAFFGDAISVYTVQDGIRDGVLVPILPHRWDELTGGKPLVATARIVAEFSLGGIMQDLWNPYVGWRQRGGKAGERFVTGLNDQEVWVVEDGEAITVLFPSDD